MSESEALCAPLKIQSWGKPEFEKNVEERWQRAKRDRMRFEQQWSLNEQAFYTALGVQPQNGNISIEDLERAAQDEGEQGVDNIAVNYIFQYIRYNHSLMSANPPDVVVKPYSKTIADKAAASDANHVKNFLRNQYNIQERVDERNLKTLTKGTGYLRSLFDSTLGDPIRVEGDCIWMEGDIRVYSPSTWDIWLSPNAKNLDELDHFFELLKMTKEEAILRWPEHAEKLQAGSSSRSKWKFNFWSTSDKEEDNTVDIILYLEKGAAINGMRGRRCYRLADGYILEFGENLNPDAQLGLDILTDIDIEDELYGKSIIEYLSPIQEILSSLDTQDLANVAVHNIVRLLVDGDAEIDDEAVTDSTVDIIQIKNRPGLSGIQYLAPPSTMPDSVRIRQQLTEGQKGLAGMNDAMTGQMTRETSSFTMDRSIESGNMVRRRLYNKYTKSIQNLYRYLLSLAVHEWKFEKQVKVVGEDGAWDIRHLRGASFKGGWDLEAQYGRSFSLDPQTKRQEIMQLAPFLEKIPGFDYGAVAREWGLDIFDESMFDRVKLAHAKQQKIFDQMISRWDEYGVRSYVAPREFEDHINMYDYCRYYYMTPEFDSLDEKLQQLIEQHMMERREALTKEAAAQQQPAQPPPQAPSM